MSQTDYLKEDLTPQKIEKIRDLKRLRHGMQTMRTEVLRLLQVCKNLQENEGDQKSDDFQNVKKVEQVLIEFGYKIGLSDKLPPLTQSDLDEIPFEV